MVIGSWAPFEFHAADFDVAWQQLLAPQSGRLSRSDFVANVLLGMPLGFCLLGATHRRKVRWETAVARVAFVLAISIAMSVVCELGQFWFGQRVPSRRDLIAQLIGTIGAIALWFGTGPRLSQILGRLQTAPSRHARFQSLVALVSAGVVVWSLMPFAVITSPVDLARKWAKGGIRFVPLISENASIPALIYQGVVSIGLGVPLGMWAGGWLISRFERPLSLATRALTALAIGFGIELLQVFIHGRVATATDALFVAAGVVIGLQLAVVYERHENQTSALAWEKKWISDPALWWFLATCYFVVIAAISWYPYQFTHDSDEIRTIVSDLKSNPFADYRGSNLRAIFNIARTAVLSSILGGLVGVGAKTIRHRTVQRLASIVAILVVVVAAGVIELGQAFEANHVGAGFGFCARLLGGVAGYLVARSVLGSSRRLQDTASQRRELSPRGVDPAAKAEYLPGMDGLRAIACLAVFGVHWQQLTGVDGNVGPFDVGLLLTNGNTGVAVFMILSGMLLSVPVLRSARRGWSDLSLKQFFWKRVGRILPIYWCCLVGIAVLGGYYTHPKHVADVMLHAGFMHNFFSQTLYSISAPFWALAPIIQFYFLFVLIIAFLRAINRPTGIVLVATFVVLGVVSQAIVTACTFVEPSDQWSADWLGANAKCLQHSLPAHLMIFTLGVVAAWIHVRKTATASYIADVLVVCCGLCVLLFSATQWLKPLYLPGGRYGFPWIPAALAILVVAVPRGVWAARVLEAFPLRRLGRVSYGFYLMHLPIMKGIILGFHRTSVNVVEFPLAFAMLAILVAYVASELAYHWIELPTRKRLLSSMRQ
ncbi:acyltransferase family protein [Stieleria maiorica]|nr:acyltransferase family protein [Stieleria maiorica]